MKIIKPSKAKPTWRGTCHECKAVVEADDSEITHRTHDQREGGYFSWETCPACGAGDKSMGCWGGLLLYPVKQD